MKRYSVRCPDYEYTYTSVCKMDGKAIREAPRCHQVFATLSEYQAKRLEIEGLIVREIKPVRHTQIGTPRKVTPSGAEAFSAAALAHAAGIRLLRELYDPPISGRGRYAAFLDTGIRDSHEGFKDRVVYNKNFSDSPTCDDIFGHGTSVAWGSAGGIVDGEEQGMLPEIGILNAKVLNDDGEGTEESVVMAMDELMNLQETEYDGLITIANMSFGSTDTGDPDNPVRVACRAGTEQRLPLNTLAACGNNGPSPKTILCPAVEPLVRAVGSINPTKDIISEFSSRGPTLEGVIKPDMVFFGDDMILADSESDTAYAVKAGTSFACGFSVGLSGAIKEVIDRFGEVRMPSGITYTMPEGGEHVREWVSEHMGEICAKPEGVPPGKDNDYGYGMPLGGSVLEAFKKEVMGGMGLLGLEQLMPMMFMLMMMGMMAKVMRTT